VCVCVFVCVGACVYQQKSLTFLQKSHEFSCVVWLKMCKERRRRIGLLCVAVYYSVLQCVAVCCSVLQYDED